LRGVKENVGMQQADPAELDLEAYAPTPH
jgi:hypothetical protein